jgi:hypothetical protein
MYGTRPLKEENVRYGKSLRRVLTFDPINGNMMDTTKYGKPFIYAYTNKNGSFTKSPTTPWRQAPCNSCSQRQYEPNTRQPKL